MIDLHCHSTVSDGALSPREVVKLAATNGCTMLALTDHDHTGGVAEAREEAMWRGIRLISGVEISVTWNSRTVHIVGLDFDEHDGSLQNLLSTIRKGRIERMKLMCDKLAKHGIDGAFDDVMQRAAANPEMVSRTHLADFLVENQYVRTKQQAFTKYLGEGKSAYVRHEWADLGDAVAAINGAGGMAVIAHPMRYDLSATGRRRLFEAFKAVGGRGMEVHSGSCSAGDRMQYSVLAQRYDLLASCGSDFHRLHDYSGGVLGRCPELPDFCEPVWQHF